MKFSRNVIFAVFFIFYASSSYAYLIQDFSSWYNQDQSFTHSGSSTTVTASYDVHLGNRFDGVPIGMLSKITVNDFYRAGTAGIGMTLGEINGKEVMVNIGLRASEYFSEIYYQIRLKEGNNLEDVAYGRFGGDNESVIGNEFYVGMARFGDEIWMLVDGYSLVKWSPLSQMNHIPTNTWLWAWGNEAIEGQINATFSDVFIINP